MRKEFVEKLNYFIDIINRSIFDLDISFLEQNGYPYIRQIKEKEPQHILDESFYVYNECMKRNTDRKQRFTVSAFILQKRGNLILLKIVDSKNNQEYTNHFKWYPLKTKKGFLVTNDLYSWLNNTLVTLNNGD